VSDPHKLPAVPGDGDVEEEIIEGEIVGEDDLAPVPLPRQVIHVAAVVVKHEHTRRVARNGAYVGMGAMVVFRRLWESRSTAMYERNIRKAEADGDHERAVKWAELLAAFRRDRHQRRVAMVELPIKVAKALPGIAAGVLGLLIVIGVLMAVSTHRIAEVVAPVELIAEITGWVALAFSVTWGPFILGAPWIAVAVLWWMGRNHARAMTGGWLAPEAAADEDGGIVITADTIVVALQNLGKIPELKRAFKDGWRPTFHTMPVRDGRGYFSVFSVPLGVTAEMVADQNVVFSRNLHRAKVETWPSDAERGKLGPPGSVALWVADRGVLDKGAPEYPLLHEGTADVFEGVPGGVTPRGDDTRIPIVGNNFVAGGQMGQGKSNSCRVIMLGCALDPLAVLDVFVFANNGDFDAYAPRLNIYRKGVEDDVVIAAVNRLQELYEEVARREARLAELGAKKVTRQLAERHPDLRPVVALFSECHELFGHPEYGELAADLATKTAKRARKTAVVLGFDTQSSRKEAIPPKLVELVSVNICFYCKTWRSNDGFLGDGSFAAGIRATELRPGRDRGTSVITGVSDGQFELLRWYFVEVDDDTGFDAATEVIARALANLAPGTQVGGALRRVPAETRDLLEDLAKVMDTERVRLADLPALLRDLAPSHPPYRSLTGVQLGALLKRLHVRTVTKSNVTRLDPADLRDAIYSRDEEEG
jgi:S-DNA-T family DNA segregation ATPase FtsK/SpoIIIE